MLDIVMIGRNRIEFLEQSLDAIVKNTKDYRLTLIDDYSEPDYINHLVRAHREKFHQIVLNGKNIGSTPSMNTGIHMSHMWQWFFNESADDPVLFLEDDIVLHKDWQKLCRDVLCLFEARWKVAFIGWDSAEHTDVLNTEEYFGHTVKIKKYIRSSMMYAKRSTWKELGLVPRLNPDGRERGFPGNGLGSRRDWYYLMDSNIALEKTDRRVATISDIAKHIGGEKSTWY